MERKRISGMSKLRQIKRRIKSVDNIAKVTKAMQLVAASRMRRAQENALLGKKYAFKIKQLMIGLSQKAGKDLDPLVNPYYSPDYQKVYLLVFSPQRGLAGSLPGNLSRFILKLILKIKTEEQKEVEVITIGKKVRDQLVRRGIKIIADFSDIPERPTTVDVRAILKFIEENYLNHRVGQVLMVFPDFISVLNQKPTAKVLLPLNIDEVKKYDETFEIQASSDSAEFVYEPNQKRIFSELIPAYLETQIYQARLETIASEYCARMVAMKNATSNASDVKDYLTLEYNKSRQSQITKELAEISAGRLGQ